MGEFIERLRELWWRLFSRATPFNDLLLPSVPTALSLPPTIESPYLITKGEDRLPLRGKEEPLSIAGTARRLRFAPLLSPNYSIAPSPLTSPINLPIGDWPVYENKVEKNVSLDTPPVSQSDTSVPKRERLPCEGFVVAEHGTWLYTSSALSFDTALTRLAYAQPVTIRGFQNGFAEVVTLVGTGFVDEDSLTTSESEVWPRFASGQLYTAESRETVLTRRLLADMFLGGVTHALLTAEEYVLLRLLQDRHAIVWPAVRPRLAGQWHSILRGVSGVHTGVVPLSDTIMEWQSDDGVGHLAYVEAVLPDQTIRVSGVGIAVVGEYSEVTLKSTIWREWRPVFINVST